MPPYQRPALIVLGECFDATNSIIICGFTSDPTDAALFRLVVQPSERNGAADALSHDGGQDHYSSQNEARCAGWTTR